jgi:hypothetical protein
MTNLMDANRQWASRPADERFTSLTDLHAQVSDYYDRSRARVVSSRALHVRPSGDARGLEVTGANGVPYAPTNWAFGQLATLAAAPAGYLRTLPAPMAADCINWGLHKRDVEDVGVLISRTAAGDQLRAATGPRYGRIWNRDIAQDLIDRFGDGVSGGFRVPGVFGRPLGQVTGDNTTLYASDRDMFVFLADEERRIELADRRDGRPGSFARGFIISNSEVGAATLSIRTFLFDYVCSNRIIWGANNVRTVAIRHTASAPERWRDEAAPALRAVAEATRESSHDIVQAITDARADRLADVSDFLARRYGPRSVPALQQVHLREEGRPIETRWDVIVAATAAARAIPHADDRVQAEAEAGELLDA